MIDKHIIGAGLAGLIAACRIKDAHIYEAGPRVEQHKALLRFRDKAVAELTGIPFQEVTVHKEISFHGEAHHRCSIAMANMYSRKVSGTIHGRSIWDLETVKRYIAPENFYDQLCDRHAHRIDWSTPVNRVTLSNDNKLISTIPLPVMMKACGMDELKFEFAKSPIRVARYRLPKGTQAYQTIYFPEESLRAFRASITGDLLIVESMTGAPLFEFSWGMGADLEIDMVTAAFGIDYADLEDLGAVDQKYGKIVEVPRAQREAILYELTRDFNVFSIGRFATWRNILLDDVVKDIAMVEKLMAASTYGRDLALAGR
jgi:hypothetical protein